MGPKSLVYRVDDCYSSQDPVKEKEAEMILDCFEKFNQVCERFSILL